eukprot:TRINITY_DN8509_c0_g1_i1.p1 TRINITY_DN8509_c0_g1~~TRINITY_DN8509_c0_g1_i1.p1  ORF type:complete len:111 (-),score=3.82 TRINITY_DN8509_c0_g1_i1:78-410(-)
MESEKADWCSLAESILAKLETEYEITIGRHTPGSARSFFGKISSFKEYLSHIGIPYIDALLENINSRFSDSVVKLLSCYIYFQSCPTASRRISVLSWSARDSGTDRLLWQ